MKQILKSIINGRELKPEEFEYNWQEFFIKRQKIIDQKTEMTLWNELESVLDEIQNKHIKNKIIDIIIQRENKITYIYYIQGYTDGKNNMSKISAQTENLLKTL